MQRSLWIALLAALVPAGAVAAPPNVVVILTDNHGAWTLGCYGNRDIRTPNIDRLASEGLRFTRAYCTQSICSPSRATFLTGLLPSQHGIHACPAEPNDNAAMQGDSLIRDLGSLPRVLAAAGYDCGLTGKWHLGGYLQPQEGFRYWFTIPGGHTYTFHNARVIHDGQVRTEPRYLTDAIADQAVAFLKQKRDRPFFLWLSFNGPYGVSDCFLQPHANRHAEFYADKALESFPRQPQHPWQKHRANLLNNPVAIRGYAAAVSGVDDGVGRVLETLRELGLDRDTLVIFTADQGLNGGHGGLWGMGEHSQPINTREAAVRIPLIFRQPGRVPANRVSDQVVAAYDLLPTVLGHVGLADRMPTRPTRPGRDFSPALAGQSMDWEQVAFHEFHTTRMIRTPNWKLTTRPDGPDELYDMEHDPDERCNLAGQPDVRAVQERLSRQLRDFFERYADRQYDLTRGGKSRVELRAYRRPEEYHLPPK